MARPQKSTKRHKPKTILRFPDLEQSKNAVVNSLAAASSQESYGHTIRYRSTNRPIEREAGLRAVPTDEFIDPAHLWSGHSYLKHTIGSRFAARFAG